MIVRNLERRPWRAVLGILTVALAVGISVVGGASSDAIDRLIEIQFERAQREDLVLTFLEPRSKEALREVGRLPGVLAVEPVRVVAATLVVGPRRERTGITGLLPGTRLHRLVDARMQVVSPPPEGLLLSGALARKLGVRVGEELRIEVTEGRRPVLRERLVATIDDQLGLNAYMDLGALGRRVGEPDRVSGVFAQVDARALDEVHRRLKQMPAVAGVTTQRALLAALKSTLAESLRIMRVMQVVFAVIIAIGVVYNTTRIALAERSRELATLRVIGMYRSEVSFILLGELALLVVLALPAGCLVGYGFTAALWSQVDPTLFRLPVIVRPQTYAFACAVVVLAAAGSALRVRRQLDRLDLVEVLKSRE
jgi:putative ABC transport system permease protein